jgi:hypothetical protein
MPGEPATWGDSPQAQVPGVLPGRQQGAALRDKPGIPVWASMVPGSRPGRPVPVGPPTGQGGR